MRTFQHVPCQVKCWLCLDISCCALLLLVGFIAGVPMGAPACFFVQRWYAMSLTLWMPSLHTEVRLMTKHVMCCFVLGKAYWYYWMWTEYIRILIIQQAVELCFWTGARLSLPSRASEGVHATGNHRGPCSFGLLGSNGSTLSAIADGKEKSTPTGPNDGWNMVKHIKWQEPP